MYEPLILVITTVIVSYLIGSLSGAIILCRLSGLPDPRSQGSGNPGATNMLRFASKKLAALVLLFDLLKSLLPAILAKMMGLDPLWVAVIVFAAFIGHIYPLFFGFKGGKGVATALGGFVALSPYMAGLLVLSWLVVFTVSRISSLSALMAFSLTPIFSLWMLDDIGARWVVLAITLILLARHQTNIKRLLAGEESKV